MSITFSVLIWDSIETYHNNWPISATTRLLT